VLGLREEAVRKRLSRARAELARSSGLGDGADSAGDPAQIEAEQRRREASR
jgi:hypothetical protein